MASTQKMKDAQDAVWNRSFHEFEAFVAAEHALPNRTTVGSGGVNLRSWLTTARKQLREGGLRADRKAKIDAVWPGWEVTRQQPDRWSENCDALTLFVADNGEPLASSDSADERELAGWLDHQRDLATRTLITGARRKRLDATFTDWNYERTQLEGYLSQGPMRIRSERGEGAFDSGRRAAYKISFDGVEPPLWITAAGAIADEDFRGGDELRYVTGFSMSRSWTDQDVSLRLALRIPAMAVGLFPDISTRGGDGYIPTSPVKEIFRLP